MAKIPLCYKTYGQAADAIVNNHLEGWDIVSGTGTTNKGYVITKVEEPEAVEALDVASMHPARHYDGHEAVGSQIHDISRLDKLTSREKIQMNVNYGWLRTREERLGNDAVDHPAHYTDGQIEVWDFIADKNLNFLLGNVVKYVCRAGKKDTTAYLEDLRKAEAYLKREMKRVQDNATD